MITLLGIMLGGGVGALLRYWLSGWVSTSTGLAFPLGTLVVNVLGAFLIGFLVVLFTERYPVPVELRLALITGVLGGFTTFSAFSYETYLLLAGTEIFKACLNIVASVGLCLAGTWLGISVARSL